MRFTNGFGVTRSALLALVVLSAFGLGLSKSTAGDSDQNRRIYIHYPDLSRLKDNCRPGIEDPCAQEAQDLAVALAALRLAQREAQEAYEAWMNCLELNGPDPDPNPNPPAEQQSKNSTTTFSILERSN